MTEAEYTNASDKAVKGLKQAELAARAGLPPVEQWHPTRKHRIDMRIAADGSWYYQGSKITRAKLVKLFASILRRDDDGSYHLITPVEQAQIDVEDAPFVAVALDVAGDGVGQTLAFTTSVGDVAVAGPAHPLRFDIDGDTQQPSPYIHIRGTGRRALEARINRAVYYQLADLGVTHRVEGDEWFGVWSDGVFFTLQRAAELAG